MLDAESIIRLLGDSPEDMDCSSLVPEFELKGKRFSHYPNPSLMGVVNLSQDSWYRESVCLSAEAAIMRGKRLFAEGAEIVDIGAESTILHAARVGEREQEEKLLPVIRELSAVGGLVSVETYHPSLCAKALSAGAAVLNMTTASGTEDFYKLVADHAAGVIICYLQSSGNVRDAGDFIFSDDHLLALEDYFKRQVELATLAGVRTLWIDPGMGFYYKNLQDSKVRVSYQMRTFLQTHRLRRLGHPVCHALPHAFEFFGEEVRTAESFFAVLALFGKTDLLRTHEVAKVRAVLESMKSFTLEEKT